jgi:uncharacterized protein (DUF433 family)/DNA-binding transcriptional MerR regulator
MRQMSPSRSDPRAIGHYSAYEVARLAGVTPRRIGQWARYGIIPFRHQSRRVYSFADAAEAVLAHYLVEQGLMPRDVRAIVTNLRERFGSWPLAAAPLEHEGRLVVLREGPNLYIDVLKHVEQEIIVGTVDLTAVRDALGRGGWVALRHPHEHIEVNPERLSGRPTIRGRRISTETVASLATRDEGLELLYEDFGLTREQIEDAVAYEAEVIEAIAA